MQSRPINAQNRQNKSKKLYKEKNVKICSYIRKKNVDIDRATQMAETKLLEKMQKRQTTRGQIGKKYLFHSLIITNAHTLHFMSWNNQQIFITHLLK